MRAKLQKNTLRDAFRKRKPKCPIEDVIGKINPREPDVIEGVTKTKLRRSGQSLQVTEIAYVKKVRAFMADRGLKRLADFHGIGATDVEAHLTDLAVDGNVAPSTQDQSFYALLFLFQYVSGTRLWQDQRDTLH